MKLGRYEVLGELARGGMGVVYSARDPQLGREVVIKLILGAVDPEARARFEREAQATARLRHPNLVAVHELGSGPRGQPFLVMDLIPGRPLEDWLGTEGPFDVDEAVRIVERLAEGIEHAHQQGVLHRDLKPENVLLDEVGGEPVLTDFGLALLSGRDTRLTLSGEAMGTPVYMPPEQANGELARIGPASDVYGLGAVLYALLTGRAPFVGTHLIAILSKVLTEEPEPPSAARAEVGPALEAIVLRCLRKDPDQRYPSAAALGEALRAWRSAPPSLPRRRVGLWATAGALLLGGVIVAATGGPAPPEATTGSPSALPRPAPQVPPNPLSAPEPANRIVRTVVIQPGPLEGKDATVRNDGYRERDNHGCARDLLVGRRGPAHQRVYMEFRLERYLPADARVQKARLELFARDPAHFARDVPVPIVARAVVAKDGRVPWVEGTSRYDHLADGIVFGGSARFAQPAVEPLASRARTVAPVGTNHWVGLDLTSLVQRWHQGTLKNYGFRLETAEGFEGNCGKPFVSSDAADPGLRPKLVVTYLGSPPLQPPAALPAARRAALAKLDGLRKLLADRHVARAGEAIRLAPFLGQPFHARAQGVWRQQRSRLTFPSVFQDCLLALSCEEPPANPVPTLQLMTEAALLDLDRSRVRDALVLVKRALKERPRDPVLAELHRRLLERHERRR